MTSWKNYDLLFCPATRVPIGSGVGRTAPLAGDVTLPSVQEGVGQTAVLATYPSRHHRQAALLLRT